MTELEDKDAELKKIHAERIELEKSHEKALEEQSSLAMAEIKELEDKLDKELEKGI